MASEGWQKTWQPSPSPR